MSTEDKKIKILAVDDEELNLDILLEYFEEEGYEIVTAPDGAKAWEILQEEEVNLVVLDRMMPNMDGISLLKKIKATEKFKATPVIMQTAATSVEEVREGVEAGAFYYLSKPYQKELLLSIVRSALESAKKYSALVDTVSLNLNALKLIKKASFEFRNLEEVKSLSALISNSCPKERNVLWGITELMLNAVEHGNLGLTYEEKKRYLIEGGWLEEINTRLQSEEYKHKICRLEFERTNTEIIITIIDQGAGFSPQKYIEIDPNRITDPNGRGIALSKQISFDTLVYSNKGNSVCCKIFL